jgi:hypothetical protein
MTTTFAFKIWMVKYKLDTVNWHVPDLTREEIYLSSHRINLKEADQNYFSYGYASFYSPSLLLTILWELKTKICRAMDKN